MLRCWKAIVFQLLWRKEVFDWRLQTNRVMVAKPFSSISRIIIIIITKG